MNHRIIRGIEQEINKQKGRAQQCDRTRFCEFAKGHPGDCGSYSQLLRNDAGSRKGDEDQGTR